MVLRSRFAVVRAAALLAAFAAAPAIADAPKHLAPIPSSTLALIAARNSTASAPILMRAYKKEGELEVWKKARGGRYAHLKTFPICRWSGQLGPKQRLGDRQTPEGFYSIAPRQMNPNSSYHLSFDTGFPNAFDRAQGASGAYLMVHGNCSSAGCFAMTDKGIEEIYALAREAFAGGQAEFQFQAFPFRMTAQNMARHRSDPNIAFWRQLKEGSDRFEATGEEPSIGVAGGRYAFRPFRDPAKEELARTRVAQEETRVAALIAEGVASVRTTYADGGQHPSFRNVRATGSLGTVSRPETLALAGREIVVTPAKKRAVQVAEAKPVGEVGPALPAWKPRLPAPTPEAEPSLFAMTPLSQGPLGGAAVQAFSGRIGIAHADAAATPFQVAAK
jgi:murein L,D-transpeptidase YafK